MQIYYDLDFREGISVGDNRVLCEELSHHIVVVLRHRVGDRVRICNGCGWLYECEILVCAKKACEVIVVGVESGFGNEQLGAKVTIGLSVLKNAERMDWAVEKIVEIGAVKIVPIISERSQRKQVNVTRLQKIAKSAAQQSLKGFLAVVENAKTFQQFITQHPKGYIAHCNNSKEKQEIEKNKENYTILIGPEGDFSPSEVQEAKSAGYTEITLGGARLRAETAAVCAVYECVVKNRK